MARWRVGVAVLLAAVLAAPLALPLAELAADPDALAAWRDAPRLLALTRTTALLLALVVGGSAAPIVSSLLGFAPAVAHASNDQGEDNDDQGENNDDQ